MIPNNRVSLGGATAGKVVKPEAPVVAYEEVLVDIYNVELPCGPSQFIIDVGSETDSFEHDDTTIKFTIGELQVFIRKEHAYFFSIERKTIRRQVATEYKPTTK